MKYRRYLRKVHFRPCPRYCFFYETKHSWVKSTRDGVLAGAKKSTTSRYRSTEKYRWLCPGWCICLLPGAALVQRTPTPSATSLSRITQTIFNPCFEICTFFYLTNAEWLRKWHLSLRKSPKPKSGVLSIYFLANILLCLFSLTFS